MEDFEKLGVFYLGRQYDLSSNQRAGLLLYDSKDLVTHGVCVGMTGSGKTGLCIGILEEAALDSVPAIVIDPKGDLADLMLTFPDLKAEDFRPWISEEEAAKKGLTPDQFAQQQAETWRKGLADWGQDSSRIRRLRDACDLTIYTPGSTAGIPVSIIKSFAAPAPSVREDEEALHDRISTAATSILGLVGLAADPIRSREHILLSNLFDSFWSAGRDLDLAGLIQQVQTPPFAKVGMLDLDAFYPEKERFELAMLLNNLLAAPTFQTWLEGEPLDIGRMLFTAGGRPRVSIFSIAHLSDAERMFFVSLLLNEVLGWVRSQSGTGSLRALLYMDEIFGFFPPVAEPPSKKPLLTLLKQARAFGVGVLLATQNPVDLDYKGLANAGTWFIGRLQTEGDKNRLLEGLEGVAADAATKFDRQEMEETLAGLGNRIFLMYNAHEDEPVVFQTRWTMSYLCGPLTRNQIKMLMDKRRPELSEAPTPQTSPVTASSAVAPAAGPAVGPAAVLMSQLAGSRDAGQPPTIPAEIPQFFLPLRGALAEGSTLVYQPGVLAAATVSFVNSDTGAASTIKVRRMAQAPESSLAVNWDAATDVESPPEDLERSPVQNATLAPLPPAK
ncbi:MAG: ATP-binding protein [Actinobacteria bacterium]|nr:ATP-binding protein [Actinomycetota bacterium]